jgi:chloramphenicol-sensitive protein RarD
MDRGVVHGLLAYAIWGTFPLYFNLLRTVPTGQTMGHRIVWSCAVLAALVAATGRVRALAGVPRRTIGIYAVAAVLIAVNWTTYVWAVTSGHVVETSLGYFVTPLVNVALGVALLGERLRRTQWAAVALAAAGVVHLTILYGQPPWIAVGLAFSFGVYGFVKKRAPLPPLDGLFVETAVLVMPALVYLLFVQQSGDGIFLAGRPVIDLLLVGTGALTVLPLLLFASAVQRVPLSIVGLLQYIAPTIQFLLGVFVFHESFSAAQFTGFALVWVALLVFAVDGIVRTRPAAPMGSRPAAPRS